MNLFKNNFVYKNNNLIYNYCLRKNINLIFKNII